MSPTASPRFMARLVWLAIGSSVIGGGATLAVLTAGLVQYRTGQQDLAQLQRRRDGIIEYLKQVTLLSVSRQLEALQPPYIEAPIAPIDDSAELLADRRCADLLNETDSAARLAAKLRERCVIEDQQLEELRLQIDQKSRMLASAIEKSIGQERLQALQKLGSRNVDTDAYKAVLRRLEHAREIDLEILEIDKALQQLVSAGFQGAVTDTEQNQIRPRIWRISLLVSRYDDWRTMLGDDVAEFEQLVSATSESDPAFEGLIARVRQRIQLADHCNEAIAELNRAKLAIGQLVSQLTRESTDDASLLAARASESFNRTLTLTEVSGLLSFMFMSLISIRVTRHIRCQFEIMRAAQQTAEEATRTKSEFLANMSHEIRTPMTAILGFSEHLLEPNQTRQQQEDVVRTIRRNGEHLLCVINDILDLSRIEAGRMAVESVPVSPMAIVADVVDLLRSRAEARGLLLELSCVNEVPETITSDPMRLRQILINLLGNAVKFTESGGVKLTVGFNDEGSKPLIEFNVHDTGVGMTDEQAGRLFQPFTQADTATTRQYGGTGLGLVISQRFAMMLGGDVVIVRSAPNRGSHFRLTVATGSLDGIEFTDTFAPESSKPAVNGRRNQKSDLVCVKLLLAEDGLDNQRLIAHVLRKCGASVTIVDNGELAFDQAMDALNKGVPFDVILMDMQMPVLDGYAATTRLRQAGYRLPVIALTAHAMSSDRERCLAAGCDDYATKPIDRKRLIELIQSFTRMASVS